jgi:uncharacterized phage infection (PIP) family protein YhgE
MIGSSIEKVLKAADVISEVRSAFEKIQNLETGQKALAETLVSLDVRVRELEAGLREAKSDIKLAAVEAAQQTVNGAQGQIYQRMVDLEVKVSRVSDSLTEVRSTNVELLRSQVK